jgi:hypothetical protein
VAGGSWPVLPKNPTEWPSAPRYIADRAEAGLNLPNGSILLKNSIERRGQRVPNCRTQVAHVTPMPFRATQRLMGEICIAARPAGHRPTRRSLIGSNCSGGDAIFEFFNRIGRVREFDAVSSSHSNGLGAGCVGNNRAVAQEISSPSAGDRPRPQSFGTRHGTAISVRLDVSKVAETASSGRGRERPDPLRSGLPQCRFKTGLSHWGLEAERQRPPRPAVQSPARGATAALT